MSKCRIDDEKGGPGGVFSSLSRALVGTFFASEMAFARNSQKTPNKETDCRTRMEF